MLKQMVNKEDESVRVRLDADLKYRFVDAYEGLKVNQQTAIREMIRWFVEQDQTVQALVVGTIPRSIATDIARLILQKMAGEAPPSDYPPLGHPPREKLDSIAGIRRAKR